MSAKGLWLATVIVSVVAVSGCGSSSSGDGYTVESAEESSVLLEYDELRQQAAVFDTRQLPELVGLQNGLSLESDGALLHSIGLALPSLAALVWEGEGTDRAFPSPYSWPSSPSNITASGLQLNFVTAQEGGSAGFTVLDPENKQALGEWFFAVHLPAQIILETVPLRSNEGEFVLVISEELAWTRANGEHFILKPQVPSPNVDNALRLSWVDVSEPSAPMTVESIRLPGGVSNVLYSEHQLTIVSSFYAWPQAGVLLADNAVGDVFDFSWEDLLFDAAKLTDYLPDSQCWSDGEPSAALHQVVKIRLADAEVTDMACVHGAFDAVLESPLGELGFQAGDEVYWFDIQGQLELIDRVAPIN